MSDALKLIAAERQRQIDVEGYTPEHDDQHGADMCRAAACYTLPSNRRLGGVVPAGWPWAASDWKPTPDDRVRELVKAGALIVAEIERLQRAPVSTGDDSAKTRSDYDDGYAAGIEDRTAGKQMLTHDEMARLIESGDDYARGYHDALAAPLGDDK